MVEVEEETSDIQIYFDWGPSWENQSLYYVATNNIIADSQPFPNACKDEKEGELVERGMYGLDTYFSASLKTTSKRPSKRPKLGHSSKLHNAPKTKTKNTSKPKLADRGTIPVPSRDEDDASDISDQDLDMLTEFGHSANFLNALDEKGITR